MTNLYTAPKQARAMGTEQKFLDALDELLYEKSLNQLTIDEIAEKAQLTRSAFLKRFGSKKQALLILYERYCEKVLVSMQEVSRELPQCVSAMDACYRISERAERLQQNDFSANRAMHELFMEKLAIAPQTKALFRECVKLMQEIQNFHLPQGVGTSTGAYTAAQLIFTINYNNTLKAMPGLPREFATRHRLIATIVAESLKF
jgi:AcrR family transcriptional regulator